MFGKLGGAVATLVFAITVAAFAAWQGEGQYFCVAFSDLWPYMDFRESLYRPSVIFVRHNEHISAPTILSIAFDRSFTGGTFALSYWISVSIALATVAALALSVLRLETLSPANKFLVYAAIVAGVLSPSAILVAGYVFFLGHLFSVLLAVIAVLVTVRMMQHRSNPFVYGAIVASLSCIGVVSGGNGILIAPSAVCAAIACFLNDRTVRGFLPKFMWTAVIPPVLLWMMFEWIVPTVIISKGAESSVAILSYFVKTVGASAGLAGTGYISAGAGQLAALLFGLFLCLIFAAAAFGSLLTTPIEPRVSSAAIGIVAFCFSSLLFVAIGRAGTQWGPIEIKYATYAGVAGGAVAVFCMVSASTLLRSMGWVALVLIIAINARVAVAYVPEYVTFFRNQNAFGGALISNALDPDLLQGRSVADLAAKIKTMRDANAGVFALREARWIGQPIESIAPNVTAECRGQVEGLTALNNFDAEPNASLRVLGFGYFRDGRKAEAVVVSDGKVSGFGGFVFNRPELAQHFGERAAGIRSSFKIYSPIPKDFEVFLVDRAGTRCALPKPTVQISRK